MRLELEVDIGEIGARGDGIARLEDGKKLFVPFTVPGDHVRVRLGLPRPDGLGGRVVALLSTGPSRAEPPCRHFGTCGGCALQHLESGSYQAWKLDLLTKALARQGVSAGALRPLFVTPPASRRRADLTAVRRKNDLLLGFNARQSHRVVDLAECPVLQPAIAGLLAPLRLLLTVLLEPADTAEVVVTRTDSGLDLLLVTGAELGLKRRERLAEFAAMQDLARIARRHPKSRGAEILVERRSVRVRFGDVSVPFPPGGFLQASAEAEAVLRAAVQEGIGAARRVVDLYAGCGTFGLPLAAEGRQVFAAEGDRQLAEALAKVVREAAGRLGLAVAVRDLARHPFAPEELDGAEAVIFDPPRAGARAQAEALARSRVERIVAVSCHPASFARDARVLVEGGYRLEWIQPVDQFLWSPHLELAAAFRRA